MPMVTAQAWHGSNWHYGCKLVILQLLPAGSLTLIVYCPVDDMQSSQTGFYTQLKHHTNIKIVSLKKKKKSSPGHTNNEWLQESNTFEHIPCSAHGLSMSITILGVVLKLCGDACWWSFASCLSYFLLWNRAVASEKLEAVSTFVLTAVDLLTDKSTQHAAQDIASVVVEGVPSSTDFVSDIHILKQFFSRQQHHGD